MQFGEDRCTQFRVIVVTDPQTHKHTQKHTDRTDNNTLRRSFASAQCSKKNMFFKQSVVWSSSVSATRIKQQTSITAAISQCCSVASCPRPGRPENSVIVCCKPTDELALYLGTRPQNVKIMGHHHSLSAPYFSIFPLLISAWYPISCNNPYMYLVYINDFQIE